MVIESINSKCKSSSGKRSLQVGGREGTVVMNEILIITRSVSPSCGAKVVLHNVNTALLQPGTSPQTDLTV